MKRYFSIVIFGISIVCSNVKGFRSTHSRTNTCRRHVLYSQRPNKRMSYDIIQEQSKVSRVSRGKFHGDHKVLPKQDRYLLSNMRRAMKCYDDKDKVLELVSRMIMTILKLKETRYDKSMLCSVFYECLCYTWCLHGIVPRNVLSSFISMILSSSNKSLQYLHINDTFVLKRITMDTLLFGLLQRCVDIDGVTMTISQKQLHYEWNQILNYFIKYPNIPLAKQMFTLQHSTNAPSLSAVTYSILIKGCIKHKDIQYIDYLYNHAINNDVVIDTVMYNTLLDAYVTLNTSLQKALDLFAIIPSPNVRSYNTLLKGYAKFNYKLSDAIVLINSMETSHIIRDHVTTNTLVSIAISNENYNDAEDILARWYYYNHNAQYDNHPNIQAYTDLIDAYVKTNKLQKALDLFYIMQTERNVVPNEYTITVLGNGLAKVGNVKAIWKLIDYARFELKMEKLSCIFYNAIFSGLLTYIGSDDNIHEHHWSILEQQKLDVIFNNTDQQEVQNDKPYILNQIKQFYNFMIHYTKSNPNETTIQLIITTLSQLNELHLLSKYITSKRFHPFHNIKIATTLLQGYSNQDNIQLRDSFFRKLQDHHLVDSFVLNTYLDSLLHNKQDKPDKDCMKNALQLFQTYKQHVNVMTFTIVISAFLKLEKDVAFDKAWKLYNCMKNDYSIYPDIPMYNCMFAIMQTSQNDSKYYPSQKRHFQFLQIVLDDISNLLSKDEYKKRKVFANKLLFRTFKNNERSRGYKKDELFENKGWNRIDSNFRVFYGNEDGRDVDYDQENSFLGRKGWNDVDSGFRII